jgi:hypothetical protein
VLRASVRQGYLCPPAFVRDPWLADLLDGAEGRALLDEVRRRHTEAVAIFEREGGPALLGV